METIRRDVRQVVRMLMRNPGFALIASLALALGIGPNTAIFSVVNTLLLTPPPYPDPSTIVSIVQTRDVAGLPQRVAAISSDDFQTWRSSTRTWAEMAAYSPDSATLTGVAEPVRLTGARVSPAVSWFGCGGPLDERQLQRENRCDSRYRTARPIFLLIS